MSYILAFDTETTGLPAKGRNVPLERQPHVIQLAFTLYNEARRPVMEVSTLVNLPDGVECPQGASDVHGISTEEANIFGLPAASALRLFHWAADRATTIIAHNAEFDVKLLDYLSQRNPDASRPFPKGKLRCTCDLSTDIINLPPTARMLQYNIRGPKRASLSECWRHFFHEELLDAHDALVDTRGCARVYFHLLDKGLI